MEAMDYKKVQEKGRDPFGLVLKNLFYVGPLTPLFSALEGNWEPYKKFFEDDAFINTWRGLWDTLYQTAGWKEREKYIGNPYGWEYTLVRQWMKTAKRIIGTRQDSRFF